MDFRVEGRSKGETMTMDKVAQQMIASGIALFLFCVGIGCCVRISEPVKDRMMSTPTPKP